jgi:hypothetical protein
VLKENDEQWLRANYPTLVWDGKAVTGTIEFSASYNGDTNQFVILGDQAGDDTGAVILAGNFRIRIEVRRDKSTSRLPALLVEGIEPISDRHFNQKDKSGCLCSPLEEREFLEPEFRFSHFLEQFVIPFLYGQVFYSSHQRWPWPEYAHGATGILEAYSKIGDPAVSEDCLWQLKQDANWLRVQLALQQKPYVKGHTLCFCTKMDQMRRCHPHALEGLVRLQRDLTARNIPVS